MSVPDIAYGACRQIADLIGLPSILVSMSPSRIGCVSTGHRMAKTNEASGKGTRLDTLHSQLSALRNLLNDNRAALS
eukprot:2977134-Rhodomonas_salina.2